MARRYRADLMRYMAECDANYIRLLKLIPHLESLTDDTEPTETGSVFDGVGDDADTWRFRVGGSEAGGRPLTVRIRILERFRYTATLEFSLCSALGRWLSAPVIGVRVYHDAATAEVVNYQGRSGFRLSYGTPNAQMYHQDEKSQINELLGEWLDLCLSAGGSLEAPRILQAV
ncbi:MAG: DUF1249 domain-containing protein [Pseudomonadota bacterium]